MNNTSLPFGLEKRSEQAPYEFKAVFSVAIFLVALVSVIGNTLVSITFAKSQKLRTSTNYYITSMALSDLLYGATLWGLFASSRLSVFGQSLSSSGCKLGNYVLLVSYSVSILSLVLITVDRFIATVFPMKLIMITGRIRAAFMSFTWIVPIVIAVPFAYFSRVADESEGPFLCVVDISRVAITTYNAVGFVLLYFVPIIVITILSVRIMKSLGRLNPVIQGNDQNNSRRLKHSKRITKLLISINVFFLICWTAHSICIILIKFFPTALKRDEKDMLFLLLYYFLPLASTAFNPVILFTFSTNYRQALRTLKDDCVALSFGKCRSCFIRGKTTRVESLELRETTKGAGLKSFSRGVLLS